MKLKPPTLLRGRKARALAGTAIAMVGLSGLVLAQATPALADPNLTTVAVGSDTIQDVYNAFATFDGGTALGSYNAVNPLTQVAGEPITPTQGSNGNNYCSFFRPNGSGQGIAALRESVSLKNGLGNSVLSGLTAPPAGTTNAAPGAGCVDIARSSSSVTSDGHQSNTGPIVFIPFALDAVALASGGSTTGTAGGDSYQGTAFTDEATVIPDAGSFTLVQLSNLYHNCSQVTVGTHVYDPTLTTATGAHAGTAADPTPIHLYIPQSGSGTAKFWVSTLGTAGTCVQNTMVSAAGLPAANAGLAGISIEEHNGFPMSGDPNGVGPFSIAQFIAQGNAVSNGGTVLTTDRRHTAVPQPLTNCSGFTVGTPSTGDCTVHTIGTVNYGVPIATGATLPKGGSLNTAFPITRNVYSVVEFARVTNPSDPLFGLLNNASVQNTLCGDVIDIHNYGFGNIGANCGAVLTANRALG